jgi:hypothetical protein
LHCRAAARVSESADACCDQARRIVKIRTSRHFDSKKKNSFDTATVGLPMRNPVVRFGFPDRMAGAYGFLIIHRSA